MAVPSPALDLAPLFAWFAAHRRDLPWRREPRDPYRVWLSEVMLQQTQVATVIPYYTRWLERFPTLADLAAAPVDDVLKAWEGLGYYSRARNFHRAAQTVITEHSGQIPRDAELLRALPGVGPYTAGAVASLAFNADAPVLDGNVRRVLSRLFALERAPDATLWRLAAALMPPGRAGLYNESLMELGATVCAPRAPHCSGCPLRLQCRGHASGDPERFPGKTVKPPTPHHRVLTAVIVDGAGRVLLGQRPREGLLGGLWEFISSDYRGPAPDGLERMVAQRAGLSIDAQRARALGEVKHAFTHFRITREVWVITVDGRAAARSVGYDQARWASLTEVGHLALTRSDQRILALYRAIA